MVTVSKKGCTKKIVAELAREEPAINSQDAKFLSTRHGKTTIKDEILDYRFVTSVRRMTQAVIMRRIA